MKTTQEYQFTDAALRVDFCRIIREAEATEASRGRKLPAVIRVTVNESGNGAQTLVHREAWEGFLSEGEEQTVNRVYKAPRYVVCEHLRVIRVDGSLGVFGHEDDGSSEWLLILGDFVKELTDRIHVKVEVF